jgi:hypothetical protein
MRVPLPAAPAGWKCIVSTIPMAAIRGQCCGGFQRGMYTGVHQPANQGPMYTRVRIELGLDSGSTAHRPSRSKCVVSPTPVAAIRSRSAKAGFGN